MSMDAYSDIVIADQSSKFRKNQSSINASAGYQQNQSRRRGRNNLHLPETRQHRGINSANASVSTGSASSRRSTMEDDMMQHWRKSNNSREYRSPQQKHSPREMPALESLVQKPKPSNERVQTEKNRMHRNTEVILGNGKSHSRANRHKNYKPKQKPQKPQKPKNNGMSKLKKLNCFASSNKPRIDDEEARRHQALITRQHYGRVVSKINSKDFHCFDEDNYGEGNSLAAGMSVITVGSKDCYKDTARSISSRTTTRHRNDKPIAARRGRSGITHKSSNSSPKDILEDLQEEEEELTSAYSYEERAGSFINLSVSDIEEQIEKRDVMSPSAVERQWSEAQQKSIQEQQQIQLQKQREMELRQQRDAQTQRQKLQEQRISATTSVVQGVVTPPRGAGSKSLMTKPSSKEHNGDGSFQEPSLNYTIHSESPMNNTSRTSQTTTSVVNLARERQQYEQQQQPGMIPKVQQQTIGPRCHFCGGPHWIYNCPHMDESSEGRRKRREGYVVNDETSADMTTATGTSSDSTTSSLTFCGKGKVQSNPLQCQVCLRHVSKAIAASLQNNVGK
eukprot:CAMPEP_0116090390 /NCGR_PEP_ID=MMETSP0327-20121206/6951_1 /TAXON_ID=44447 /ORGANISM="Pseudo-nitzschia delicatissima, Strain B596" /LENGTH=563 /DNA_ID=CAMNT_0003581681 /DNA_START=171 /DNA_END=1862 /DNA_ORIENTATION=-